METNNNGINNLVIKKEFFIKETDGLITQYYEVIKKIGEGGSSKVYKVKEKSTGEIRVMKEVNKSKLPNVKYFKTEIKILAMLDHPNILRLFEVFEDQKNFYLITELCTGGHLLSRMSKNHYREKEAAKLMEKIISAVAYCHEKGICHRDLKPQNILFCDETPNSQLKIVDFGISKIYDPSLSSLKEELNDINKNKKMTSQIGTRYYLSPEAIKGSYTEKCDIWSLGIILYILLSGYPPFMGENDNQILQNIISCKFTFPNPEWKNISDSAKNLISSMLCPEKKRISAKEVFSSKWLKNKLKKKEENKISFNFVKLNRYRHYNKFKKCVLLFLASRLDMEECGAIPEIFRKINSCKTGMITFDDFKNFIINNQDQEIMGGEDDEEIKKKFFEIDIDLNNKIDFTEFLAANLSKSIYRNKKRLRNAFDSFDIDKNGIITREDIINILKIEKLIDAKQLPLFRSLCSDTGHIWQVFLKKYLSYVGKFWNKYFIKVIDMNGLNHLIFGNSGYEWTYPLKFWKFPLILDKIFEF